MRFTTVVVVVLLCLSFALPFTAQERASDPISGVWFGDYGSNPKDRTQVRLTLDWDGKVLIGNVSTGDEPLELEKTKFDPKTGILHMEITVPGQGKLDYHFIADGKLDKDVIAGTWHNEIDKGDFQVKKIP